MWNNHEIFSLYHLLNLLKSFGIRVELQHASSMVDELTSSHLKIFNITQTSLTIGYGKTSVILTQRLSYVISLLWAV